MDLEARFNKIEKLIIAQGQKLELFLQKDSFERIWVSDIASITKYSERHVKQRWRSMREVGYPISQCPQSNQIYAIKCELQSFLIRTANTRGEGNR